VKEKEKPLVLIIEDDEDVRGLLKTRMNSMGIKTIETTDGGAGRSFGFICTRPILIIMDVMLPKMNGFELVDILRQRDICDAPLLVYTGLNLSKGRKGRS